MKIRFLKSPTGVFNLAYFPGDEVDIDSEKAKLLVDGEFAEVITPDVEPEQEPQEKEEPATPKRGRKSK